MLSFSTPERNRRRARASLVFRGFRGVVTDLLIERNAAAVENRRDREGQERQQPVNFIAGLEIINQFDDKERDEQDAQDRDFVRRRHGKRFLHGWHGFARMEYCLFAVATNPDYRTEPMYDPGNAGVPRNNNGGHGSFQSAAFPPVFQ